jgi:phage-related protein
VSSLADVYVQVRGTTTALAEDARKGGEKAGQEAGEGFKSSFGGAMKALATGFAALEVFSFLKESVAAGREAAAQQRITAAAIASTGGAAGVTSDEVSELTRKVGELDGVQGDVIRTGANLLLTFTNIKNSAGAGNDVYNQATSAIVDMTAAMNHGVVTQEELKASSIQVGKALNDPINGATALKRVGVTLSDEQKTQIANFVKAGDVMSAQKIILAELNKEFGGAAAAASDPAQKASVAWHDFQEEIGTKLLPVITQLVSAFLPLLPTIVAIVGGVADFITHNKLLTEILAGVIAAVWLLNIAMDANPVGLIVLGIAALIVAVIFLWQHFEGFRNFIKGAWADILIATRAVVDFFTKDVPAAWSWVWEHAVQIFQLIRLVIKGEFDLILAVVRFVVQFFTVDIPAGWDLLVSSTREKFGQVKQWIIDHFNAAVDFVSGIPGRIWAFFEDFAGKFWTLGSDIVSGIIRGVENEAGRFKDVILNMARDALDSVKNFLGIGSPSKVWADEVGAQIPAGIAVGVDAGASTATGSVDAMAAGLGPRGTSTAVAGGPSDVVGVLQRIEALLAALRLTVGPEGLALAVRAGEKNLKYAGATR